VSNHLSFNFDNRLASIVSNYRDAGLINLAIDQTLQGHVDIRKWLEPDLSPVVKNSEQLFREYEVEKWSRELNRIKSMDLRNNLNLDDIYTPDSKLLTIRVFDKLFETELVVARRLFIECLAALVSELMPEVTSILDVGSGTGATLLPLLERVSSINVPIYATDISPSGLEVLQTISAIMGRTVLTCTHDFSSGLQISLRIPIDSLVITSFSLSCLPTIPKSFFQDLINLEPKYVLHIESLYETLDTTYELDTYARKYIEWNKYNQDLKSELEFCIKQNSSYEMVYQSPTFFGQNPSFPLSIVLWGKINNDSSIGSSPL
jgi:hypothetical protein